MNKKVSLAFLGTLALSAIISISYLSGCSLFCQNAKPEKFIGKWVDPDAQETFTIDQRENLMLLKLRETTLSGKISCNCIEMKNLSGESIKACLEGDSTLVLKGEGQGDLALQKAK